ncbi:unnamed protein product [Sphagnum compactum]
MEVAWRGPGAEQQLSRAGTAAGAVFDVMKKKRAWGVDAHKVVQLMMGQLQHESGQENTAAADAVTDVGDEVTLLDLLGGAAGDQEVASAGSFYNSPAPRPVQSDINMNNSGCSTSMPELLELDPDHQPRLPSDWKMCLDLKTGKMSFVHKTTGVTLDNDPRNRAALAMQDQGPALNIESSSATSPRRAHEFLRSKKSENILRAQESSLKTVSTTSSSSGAGTSARKQQLDMKLQQQQMLSFSTGSQLWNLQLDDMTNFISLVKDQQQLVAEGDTKLHDRSSNLELDLNLTASGAGAGPGGSPAQVEQQSCVCTMEMVERALRETGDRQHPNDLSRMNYSRELPISNVPPKLLLLSGSPSFSSQLTSAARSEPACSTLGSPSTSATSSATSASRSPPRLEYAAAASVTLQDDFRAFQTAKSLSTGNDTVAAVAVVAGPDHPHQPESCCKSNIKPVTADRHDEAAAATDGDDNILQLVMGACTRCLMYVMLAKSNHKCPRCGSQALLDFTAAPAPAPAAAAAAATATTTTSSSCGVKRQRVEFLV